MMKQKNLSLKLQNKSLRNIYRNLKRKDVNSVVQIQKYSVYSKGISIRDQRTMKLTMIVCKYIDFFKETTAAGDERVFEYIFNWIAWMI